MAINKKAPSEVKKAPSAVASMNPDNMISGGLMDDFDGVITKARFVPWDYEGKIDHHILAVALTIKPDDGEEFTQHYSAGELESFVPSMDGETGVDLEAENPSPEDLEGIYALKVGKKEGLNNNTNWAQWLMALIDAGFNKSQLAASLEFAEGIYGHWNRVPQKKRSGIMQQQNQQQEKRNRNNDLLVITELKEQAQETKSAPKPAPKANTSKPAAPSKPATSGIEDRLREVVKEAIGAAGEDGLTKAKLAPIVMKAFAAADKAKAVKRVGEAEFLESGGEDWIYDADSGTLYAI